MSLEKTLHFLAAIFVFSLDPPGSSGMYGMSFSLMRIILRPMEMSQMPRLTSLTMHPIRSPGKKVVLPSPLLPGILYTLLISCPSPTPSNWRDLSPQLCLAPTSWHPNLSHFSHADFGCCQTQAYYLPTWPHPPVVLLNTLLSATMGLAILTSHER